LQDYRRPRAPGLPTRSVLADGEHRQIEKYRIDETLVNGPGRSAW